MKDSTRRLVLFLVIIVAGSFMMLVNIPVFYLLAGVIILGILLLFLTGAIELPKREKKEKGEKKAKPAKEKRKTKPGRDEKIAAKKAAKEAGSAAKKEGRSAAAEPGRKRSKSGISEFFSTMKGAFSVLGRDLRSARGSPKEKVAKQKKIDEMLGRSVSGESDVSLDDIVPDIVPAKKKKGVDDPFSELAQDSIKIDSMEDLDVDLDIPLLDDEDLDAGAFGMDTGASPVEPADYSKMDINLDADETPIAIDEEEDDEVTDILKAHQDVLDDSGGEEDALSLDDDMGDFGDIDLNSVDMGEEMAEEEPAPEKAGPSPVSAAGAGTAKAASLEGAAPVKMDMPAMSDEDEMISFGSGSRQDDDLMASLRSEAKGVKKEENLSLLRDLKDVKVPASDLEKELEGLLKITRRKE
jgi:hypothetical protein